MVQAYTFLFAKPIIEAITGNELAMQNRINVNIMMPNDTGSNIPLHIDAHSGESPFQCVMWLPMTDAHDTKSVFLLTPEMNKEALKHFKNWMEDGGRKKVMKEIIKDLIFVEVPFGSYLLFSPNLIHGSLVNLEGETRWTFNTRFKGIFTPYVIKKKALEVFISQFNYSTTHFGLQYSHPDGMKIMLIKKGFRGYCHTTFVSIGCWFQLEYSLS